MALVDIQERWERMAPREQKLLSLLGLVFVIGIIGTFGAVINSGLDRITERNAEMREALQLIADNKDKYSKEKGNSTDRVALIGAEATPLATYLESIASEVGIDIPESKEGTGDKSDKFVEKTIEIKLRGLNIVQLGAFLNKVETKSPVVVTKELMLKTQFQKKEALDLELTVATYAKAEKPKDKKKSGDSDSNKSDDQDKKDE